MRGTDEPMKESSPGGIINGELTLTVTEGPHAGGTMELRFRNYPLEPETVFDIGNLLVVAADNLAKGGDS